MAEHNEKNIETLARVVIEEWDMDTLLAMAQDMLESYYLRNPLEFSSDWTEHKEELESGE